MAVLTKRKTKKTKSPKKDSYTRGCSRIIHQFNDPSKPISTWDFKTLLFFCLHDAYLHGDESSMTDRHLATIYFLWDILDQIETLEKMKS